MEEPTFATQPEHDSSGDFEVMVLGTSPVLLIEALLRARSGQRVVIVEAHEDLGGCWRTTELGGIRGIEGACHLLENYPGAYELFEELTGIGTHPCRPAPEVIYPTGKRVPYISRARTIGRLASVLARISIVAVIRCAEWFTAGRLRVRRTARFHVAEGMQRFGILWRHPLFGSRDRRAVRYIDGGAPRMLRQLHAELTRLDVTTLREDAETLEFPGEGRVRVRCASGQVIEAKELVCTESVSLRGVTSHGQTQTFQRGTVTHPHLIVEVRGLPDDHLSYIQLPDDPFIPRVADVTNYADRTAVDHGHRILVIQLYDEPSADTTRLVAAAVDHLRRCKVLPAGVETVQSRRFEIDSATTTPCAATALGELNRAEVSVLPSRGDLCLTLLQNQKRWQRYLDERGAPELRPTQEESGVEQPATVTPDSVPPATPPTSKPSSSVTPVAESI